MQQNEKQKVVVFTGAGISAESGLSTFRDADGLWENYKIEDICTRAAYKKDRQLVIDFYNKRKEAALKAQPNDAHYAIAKLEEKYDVTVVTQNVDDLHERAGSTDVLHLHGQLNYAQSSLDPNLVYDWGDKPIEIGQKCERGSQLRPNIVLFDEPVTRFDEALNYFTDADKILAVGSSLVVMPAALLLDMPSVQAQEKVLVTLDLLCDVPQGYRFIKEKATLAVPKVCEKWLSEI